jgi:hypothetical protein
MASASAPRRERPVRTVATAVDATGALPARLSDDDVARIVDALEARILDELDRRGGRLGGLL